MLVCVCRGITDNDVKNEIFEGSSSFKTVASKLGLGGCCGQCVKYAKDLVSETLTELQLATQASLSYEIKC